jgi:hypothetical protein
MRWVLMITGVGLAMLGVGSVVAHHAFGAEFDPNRPVQLRGALKRIEWVNPHSWFHVLTNGETLFMGSSGTGAPQDGADPTERR